MDWNNISFFFKWKQKNREKKYLPMCVLRMKKSKHQQENRNGWRRAHSHTHISVYRAQSVHNMTSYWWNGAYMNELNSKHTLPQLLKCGPSSPSIYLPLIVCFRNTSGLKAASNHPNHTHTPSPISRSQGDHWKEFYVVIHPHTDSFTWKCLQIQPHFSIRFRLIHSGVVIIFRSLLPSFLSSLFSGTTTIIRMHLKYDMKWESEIHWLLVRIRFLSQNDHVGHIILVSTKDFTHTQHSPFRLPFTIFLFTYPAMKLFRISQAIIFGWFLFTHSLSRKKTSWNSIAQNMLCLSAGWRRQRWVGWCKESAFGRYGFSIHGKCSS